MPDFSASKQTFRIIKIIAIIYVSIIYAVFALIITQILDKHVFHSETILLDKPTIEKESLYWMLIHTFFIFGTLGAISYASRNVVQQIPFPLDGLYNFEYKRVKEVANGGAFVTILYAFSETIYKRYSQIKTKLNISHT